MVPSEEIRRRQSALQQQLRAADVEGALLVEKTDYYYFTGTMQTSYLYVPAEGDALLMVIRDWDRAREESPIPQILKLTSPSDITALIENHYGRLPATLGLEYDVLPVKDYQRFQTSFPNTRMRDVSRIIRQVRSCKSPWEIEQMQRAAEVSVEVYSAIPRLLRPGISEIELASLLEVEAKKRGHEGLLRMRSLNGEIYTWHVVSGVNGSMLSSIETPIGGKGMSPAFPVGASLKQIQPGEPVLVDFGVVINGYQVDQTRMYCIGKMPEQFQTAYEACREIQQAVIDASHPGVSCDQLFRLSVEVAGQTGFGKAYLGPEGQKCKFVGHGVGLEINELPFLAPGHDYPLKEGMTIAIEPKMNFPGVGGAGIEDTVVVTADGARRITMVDTSLIEV